jgi:hypothetical protein
MLMPTRPSRVPWTTAASRHDSASRTARVAARREWAVEATLQIDSIPCASASMPDAAEARGPMLAVSAGSTIATFGRSVAWSIEC